MVISSLQKGFPLRGLNLTSDLLGTVNNTAVSTPVGLKAQLVDSCDDHTVGVRGQR